MANGKEGWVSFKYERLPNICYWCGMLTHSDRDCLLWEKSRGSLRGKDQQFGAWLRASTPNLSRRSVIRVAGIEDDECRDDDDDDQHRVAEGQKPVSEMDGDEDAE